MLRSVYMAICGFFLSFMSFFARAAGPDFSGMTGQIDWTTAIAALLLVAGGLAAVYVVMTGSGLINAKIKSGR